MARNENLTTVESWDALWSRADVATMISKYRGRAGRRWRALLTQLLDSPTVAGPVQVLELGCAPGAMLRELHRLRPANLYSGVDSAPKGIEIATELLRTAGVTAQLHTGDLRSIRVAPVDLVVSFGLVEHFEDPGEIMRHHRAFLKPGGVAAVTVPNYSHPAVVALLRWFSPATLATHNTQIMSTGSMRSAFAAAGFTGIRVGESGGPTLPSSRVRPGPLGQGYRFLARAWNASTGPFLEAWPWSGVIWGTGVNPT